MKAAGYIPLNGRTHDTDVVGDMRRAASGLLVKWHMTTATQTPSADFRVIRIEGKLLCHHFWCNGLGAWDCVWEHGWRVKVEGAWAASNRVLGVWGTRVREWEYWLAKSDIELVSGDRASLAKSYRIRYPVTM